MNLGEMIAPGVREIVVRPWLLLRDSLGVVVPSRLRAAETTESIDRYFQSGLAVLESMRLLALPALRSGSAPELQFIFEMLSGGGSLGSADFLTLTVSEVVDDRFRSQSADDDPLATHRVRAYSELVRVQDRLLLELLAYVVHFGPTRRWWDEAPIPIHVALEAMPKQFDRLLAVFERAQGSASTSRSWLELEIVQSLPDGGGFIEHTGALLARAFVVALSSADVEIPTGVSTNELSRDSFQFISDALQWAGSPGDTRVTGQLAAINGLQEKLAALGQYLDRARAARERESIREAVALSISPARLQGFVDDAAKGYRAGFRLRRLFLEASRHTGIPWSVAASDKRFGIRRLLEKAWLTDQELAAYYNLDGYRWGRLLGQSADESLLSTLLSRPVHTRFVRHADFMDTLRRAVLEAWEASQTDLAVIAAAPLTMNPLLHHQPFVRPAPLDVNDVAPEESRRKLLVWDDVQVPLYLAYPRTGDLGFFLVRRSTLGTLSESIPLPESPLPDIKVSSPLFVQARDLSTDAELRTKYLEGTQNWPADWPPAERELRLSGSAHVELAGRFEYLPAPAESIIRLVVVPVDTEPGTPPSA